MFVILIQSRKDSSVLERFSCFDTKYLESVIKKFASVDYVVIVDYVEPWKQS